MHLKMIVYEVKQITEADFGCEDTGRTEPMALLMLKKEADDSESVETKYVVVRKGEEKMAFASKKEADAHDKLLDLAEAFTDWLLQSGMQMDETGCHGSTQNS